MQAKEILNEKLRREYQVCVPASLVEEKTLALVKEKGRNYKAPGFRPGKVPLPHLKQVFYAQVIEDALNVILYETSQEVLKKNNLTPALRPHFHIDSFKEGQDFEYRMTFELLPEVPEVTWTDLKVKQYKVKVPEEQVDEELKQFAKSHKTSKPLEAPRPAQKGDTLVVEIEMLFHHQKEPAILSEPIKFELGTTHFTADIEDALVGLSQGDIFEKELIVPPEVENRKLVGKPYVLKICIKEIRETLPFELNEEFATALNFKDLEACRQDFRKNLEEKGKDFAFLILKRQVLDYLAGRYSFEVPKEMVDLEFKAIWDQTLSEMGVSSASNEDEPMEERNKAFQEYAGKNEDALKEDYKKIALRRVRLGIVLSTIGKQANIKLSQEEIAKAIYEKAKTYPGKEQEVLQYYRNNSEAVLSLQAPLFENKIIQHMVSQANVAEEEINLKDLEDYFEKNMGAEDFA